MNIARAVRQIYEKRPYPNLRSSAVANRRWRLPPLPWIKVIWQRQQPPRRILVAGCGIGSEAFTFRRRFPDAEIVAIDFSSRSIRVAKNLQRKNRKLRTVRFVVCDLTNSRLPKIVGDGFDFVSCHGVLTYIPRARQGLRNLARCLVTDGALYLGVNGKTHFSRSWRQVLPGFGVKVIDFQDTQSLRRILKLFDVLSGHRSGSVADSNSGYLASDLFGPLLQNWSLKQWARIYRAAGLHLLGSYSIFRPLRVAFQDALYHSLMPRSRAEVVELFEILRPSQFHCLILSRQPELRPPWRKLDKLRNWRPIITHLYHRQWPQKTQRWMTLRNLKLKSPSTNTLVELRMPEWQIELLRRSNGRDSISDISRSIPVRIPSGSLRDQFYLLYQLGAINLLPPPVS
jgi:SAM-dependent methyltransferase